MPAAQEPIWFGPDRLRLRIHAMTRATAKRLARSISSDYRLGHIPGKIKNQFLILLALTHDFSRAVSRRDRVRLYTLRSTYQGSWHLRVVPRQPIRHFLKNPGPPAPPKPENAASQDKSPCAPSSRVPPAKQNTPSP